MIEALLLLLLLVVWINLHRRITLSLSQTEALLKEMAVLKKLLADRAAEERPETPVSGLAGRAVIPADSPLGEDKTLPEDKIPSKPAFGQEGLSVIEAAGIPETAEVLSPGVLQPSAVPPPPPGLRPAPDCREAAYVAPAALSSSGPSDSCPSPTAVCPPPPPPLPSGSVPATSRRQVNYEKYIGENLFGKIGILILVIGMGLFVKYAIDNDWINETLRTVLGFAVGGVLLVLAFRLKEPYRMFSSLLAGGAFAIFYVTIAIAYHYYELFSQPAAFVLLVVITVLMSVLAILYDRRELAVIALTGGFIAPFLVSNGMGSYLVLFTYVLILDLGMFVLSFYRRWGELPVICFVFTWTILGGYASATDLYMYGRRGWLHLLLFALSFYLIFLLPVVSIVRINRQRINQILLGVLTLNHFVFLFFALWFLREMEWEHNYNGALTLFIALVNFALLGWIRRKGAHFPFLFRTLLGLGLAFVSVTIPIQLNGTLITLFWATETVAVVWFYTRLKSRIYGWFVVLLPVLTLGSYLIDLSKDFFYPSGVDDPMLFRSGLFATGIYLGVAMAVSAWLMKRAACRHTLFLISAVGVLYTAFIIDFYLHIHPALLSFSYMQLFTAVVLLGLTVLWSRKSFPMPRYTGIYVAGLVCSLLWFVVHTHWVNHVETPGRLPFLFEWISLVAVSAQAVWIGRCYYRVSDFRRPESRNMTLFLSLTGTGLLLIATNTLLHQLGLPDETDAGFSIALALAGFIQMTCGMRLHLKILRMVSLGTFGVVLFKLGAVDLWLLPTIGKVIVFILLGVILLVLSFLYQKLKSVLFDDTPDAGRKKQTPAGPPAEAVLAAEEPAAPSAAASSLPSAAAEEEEKEEPGGGK